MWSAIWIAIIIIKLTNLLIYNYRLSIITKIFQLSTFYAMAAAATSSKHKISCKVWDKTLAGSTLCIVNPVIILSICCAPKVSAIFIYYTALINVSFSLAFLHFYLRLFLSSSLSIIDNLIVVVVECMFECWGSFLTTTI